MAIASSLRSVGRAGLFSLSVLRASKPTADLFAELVREIYKIGARSLPIIAVGGAFVGLSLTLLGYRALETYGASDQVVTETRGIDVAQPAVPVGWESVFEEAEDDEHAFFLELAEHDLPVPEIGDEMDGVMLQVSWPDHKVAVVYDPDA